MSIPGRPAVMKTVQLTHPLQVNPGDPYYETLADAKKPAQKTLVRWACISDDVKQLY